MDSKAGTEISLGRPQMYCSIGSRTFSIPVFFLHRTAARRAIAESSVGLGYSVQHHSRLRSRLLSSGPTLYGGDAASGASQCDSEVVKRSTPSAPILACMCLNQALLGRLNILG